MALCRRFRSVKKNTRRVAWPVLQSRCKALSALSQNTLKNTKTGRKSVGFLILTQAPKCTRFHCFPPQKHPKNGFVMRFAGKNSFFQLRARDFSFYMNAYSSETKFKAAILPCSPFQGTTGPFTAPQPQTARPVSQAAAAVRAAFQANDTISHAGLPSRIYEKNAFLTFPVRPAGKIIRSTRLTPPPPAPIIHTDIKTGVPKG